MKDTPSTRLSLLVRLRDSQDDLAWAEFMDLYAPLLHGFIRKQGLQDADAADLTQEVFRVVAGSIKTLDYDPRRGTFRGWLFTVVRNKLRNFLLQRRRHGQGSGDSALHEMLAEQPAPTENLEDVWERECERRRFAWAADLVHGEVQETTWQAFWRSAVEGQRGQEVADALGISVAAVYLAKSRVMVRLKQHLAHCPLE